MRRQPHFNGNGYFTNFRVKSMIWLTKQRFLELCPNSTKIASKLAARRFDAAEQKLPRDIVLGIAISSKPFAAV
jgi:hypothetical protein